eukprot:TRINITY_DN3832_c0_g1_i5.p1 TRINITY_DN3832_c0_g1~~TRINITY_DN3832_c0_g1_i5.p1  ORF type:complete len:148 (+),score=43.43 TRINITY_DN3832_c0_g1_i5:61-504(+)
MGSSGINAEYGRKICTLMEPTNEGKVTLSVTPESSSVSADVEREMLLMVSVKAPLYQLEQRSSVDVVSVIDRSGSMDGERLRLVKEAMFFVVHNLTHHDRLGIVSYEGSVTVEMPFVAMDERGKVHFSTSSGAPLGIQELKGLNLRT